MKFTKMHGLGNDFVLIEGKELPAELNLADLAIKMCDRHFGIGADGLIIILPSECADAKMRIFNSDGSEPEMCGNGIRCFAKYVYENGIVKKQEIKVETLAGIIVPRLEIEEEKISGICVDMGEPQLDRSLIPMLGEPGLVVNETLLVAGQPYQITAISMGNPHCIVFTGSLEDIQLSAAGRLLETHYVFPKKTNVEFVQILNPNEVRVKVWERGAGETLACGTGACAVAVAGVLNLLTARKVTVHLAGGDLEISWNEHDNHVYMTGPAEAVFTGDYQA